MQTLKNDLEIIRKKAKIRKHRKPYPKMKSKSGKWICFDSPEIRYFGGAIHWVGKDGKINIVIIKPFKKLKKKQ